MYIHCGPEPANITINTIDSTQFLFLQPNEVYKMNFEETMFPVAGAESKAIRVESNTEIQVLIYKEDKQDYRREDVYEVPNSMQNGMQFVTSAYYSDNTCINSAYGNQFYVITTVYDNTTITIQHQDDSPFEVCLPSFGTFTTVSFDYTNRVASGTLITSDVPVTVCVWKLV